ncbi:MAG: permease-like cell division protein FtsX [Ruminococcus sp.]|nr:permease-like cell division protein FtsX [Ruminococcus sp.]MDY4909292.1 permease-like cell division protein FtsX [Candidatus Fimenecus sp.]
MKGSSLRYLTREGFRNVWVNKMMSIASVAVLMACLLIIGIGAMAYFNINSLLDIVEAQNIVMVYVSDEADDVKTSELRLSLENMDNIASCEFVPKEDAFQRQVELMGGDSALFEGFKTSPLPDAFKVTVKDLSRFKETVSEIEKLDGVYNVRENSDLASKLVTVRRAVTIVSAGLVSMLFLVALFIISNTIRITMFSRKLEINIMKAVGATNSFIRWPFMVEGVLLGIISAGVSVLLLWGLYELIIYAFSSVITMLGFSFVPFLSYIWYIFGAFLAIGIITGSFGSMVSMNRYLKEERSVVTNE